MFIRGWELGVMVKIFNKLVQVYNLNYMFKINIKKKFVLEQYSAVGAQNKIIKYS